MTTTLLSNSQQVALQQALFNSKLLNSANLKSDNPPSLEPKAYSDIAVMLYRFNLQKIKWPSFLKAAISAANNVCQWLTCELVRCQQSYKAQSDEAVSVEQSAFFCGVFSEELAYIEGLLGKDDHAD